MNAVRPFLFAVSLLLVSSLIPAPADSIPVVEGIGRIHSVTVFPDRAIVERRLTISTEGKPQKIRFVQLPATMLPDSVRVSAESAQIMSIAGKKRPEDSSNPALTKHLLELQVQIRDETDRITNLQDQIKSLNSFAISEQNDSSTQVRAGTLSTEALAKALQFFEDQRASYLKRIAASELRRSALQKELKELSSDKSNRTSPVEIEATLVGKLGSEATVSLAYMVDSASYKTEYDLYGTTGGSSFMLKSSAIIRQSTGEDWKDALITLSSARPRLSLSPGMLHPWRLTAQSAVRAEEQAKRDDAERNASGEDSASFSITLNTPVTVNSDAESYRIGLSETPLSGSLDHVAIPSISTSVFLRVRMKNDTGRPLLWDAVQIYLDGNFTGMVRPRGSVASGADFELYLGSDQRIQIRRDLIRGDVVGSGLIEKTVEIENTWQIEITNHSKKEQIITVLDQFPVSADPRITSKFHGSSRPDVNSDANGMLSWQITVKPAETQRFDFRYSIEMTRDIFEQIRQSTNGDPRRPSSPSDNAPTKQQFNLERMLNK
jgi:hypothetical protein